MKLAVIVGHNARAQGAVRADTGESEYLWNGGIAQIMENMAPEYGLEVRVFRRVDVGSFSREIRTVYANSDKWGAEASMELHFNSASSSSATGTEMLTSGTADSMRFATCVQDQVLKALNLRDRGIHIRGGKSRGGKNLISGRAPAILVEPFFGSNPKDQETTDEAHEKVALACAYLKGAALAFDVEKPLAEPSAERRQQEGWLTLVGRLLKSLLNRQRQ